MTDHSKKKYDVLRKQMKDVAIASERRIKNMVLWICGFCILFSLPFAVALPPSFARGLFVSTILCSACVIIFAIGIDLMALSNAIYVLDEVEIAEKNELEYDRSIQWLLKTLFVPRMSLIRSVVFATRFCLAIFAISVVLFVLSDINLI